MPKCKVCQKTIRNPVLSHYRREHPDYVQRKAAMTRGSRKRDPPRRAVYDPGSGRFKTLGGPTLNRGILHPEGCRCDGCR